MSGIFGIKPLQNEYINITSMATLATKRLPTSPGTYNIGVDEFIRMVERLGNQSALSRLNTSLTEFGLPRDPTHLTIDTHGTSRQPLSVGRVKHEVGVQ